MDKSKVARFLAHPVVSTTHAWPNERSCRPHDQLSASVECVSIKQLSWAFQFV